MFGTKKINYWLGVCLLVVSGFVDSKPVINSVEGILKHGQAIQVKGAGFGATGRELPNLFDDFESGDLGNNLNTGLWSTDSGNGSEDPIFDNFFAFSGSQSGYGDMSSGGDSAAFIRGVNSSRIYVSLMFRYKVTSGSPSTTKGVRVHADDGPNVYTSYPGVFVQDYLTSNRNTIGANDDGGTFSDYGPGNIEQNRWVRLEYYIEMSSPAGASNGIVNSWVDMKEDSSWAGVNRAAGVNDVYQLVMMPFYFGNGGAGKVWYDDVYISRSKARLELCDSGNWSDCSGRSIQVPSSWSGSVIEAKLNLAGLDGANNLYLYVVGDDGAVSDSFLLGSAPIASGVAPLAPSNFQISTQ